MLGVPPVSKYAICAGREIHYLEWGRADLPPVVAWHGLARVGRDFDALARELAGRYRVIAPDTIGRGLSEWVEEGTEFGDAEYCFDVYGRSALDLCDKLGIETMRWVGTSMGGSFGMWLAGGPLKDRISHLVINDIGPELPQAAIDRIVTYLGAPPEFNTLGELERYLRTVYAPFGYIPGDEWRAMTEASFRRLANGKVTSHYDPRIARQFVVHPDDWRLWERYDAITAKTFLLRGEYSDLLSPKMTEEMTRRGPKTTVLECAGCGHAPALNVPVQTEAIAEFLES
jgi:pimeloyl-ACP methyl ester carboxylesterase